MSTVRYAKGVDVTAHSIRLGRGQDDLDVQHLGLAEPGVQNGTAQGHIVGWRIDQAIPTCANCHSFSKDGKTLALDVDGPQNDKGTYAIVSLAPQTSIRTEDVFTWNDFPDKPPGQRTIGFMAQLSPDARYAVTTVNEDVFVDNFKDYRFLQVFYPTRGILAWYDRSTGRIRALPGADNPNFVQTNGFWSPDGKYLVFARAA